MLALAPPADAKIVYTPANVKIVQNGGLILFDLNHDGIPDFGLSNKYRVVSGSRWYSTLGVVQARQANQIWQVNSQGRVCAGALPKGTKVGPSTNFKKDPKTGLVMAFADFEGTTYGPWLRVKQGYLGLKFVIKGKTHFGWARVKRLSANSVTLTGYAYETIPNKPIIAGKTKGRDEEVGVTSLNSPTVRPGSLGLLAMGLPGLSVWRREQPASATY